MLAYGQRGHRPNAHTPTGRKVKKQGIYEERMPNITTGKVDNDEAMKRGSNPYDSIATLPHDRNPFGGDVMAVQKKVKFRPEKRHLPIFDDVRRRNYMNGSSGTSGEERIKHPTKFIAKNDEYVPITTTPDSTAPARHEIKQGKTSSYIEEKTNVIPTQEANGEVAVKPNRRTRQRRKEAISVPEHLGFIPIFSAQVAKKKSVYPTVKSRVRFNDIQPEDKRKRRIKTGRRKPAQTAPVLYDSMGDEPTGPIIKPKKKVAPYYRPAVTTSNHEAIARGKGKKSKRSVKTLPGQSNANTGEIKSTDVRSKRTKSKRNARPLPEQSNANTAEVKLEVRKKTSKRGTKKPSSRATKSRPEIKTEIIGKEPKRRAAKTSLVSIPELETQMDTVRTKKLPKRGMKGISAEPERNVTERIKPKSTHKFHQAKDIVPVEEYGDIKMIQRPRAFKKVSSRLASSTQSEYVELPSSIPAKAPKLGKKETPKHADPNPEMEIIQPFKPRSKKFSKTNTITTNTDTTIDNRSDYPKPRKNPKLTEEAPISTAPVVDYITNMEDREIKKSAPKKESLATRSLTAKPIRRIRRRRK